MKKEMIDTIVSLLSDLPDNKATSVMDYVKSLKHYTDSEVNDGVREAFDLYSKNGGEAGP